MIEAGWLVMMATCYPNGITEDQIIQLAGRILDPVSEELTDD